MRHHGVADRPDAGADTTPSRPGTSDRDDDADEGDRDTRDGGSNEGMGSTGAPGSDAGGTPQQPVATSVTRPTFDAGSDPERNAVAAGELCDRLATLQCAAEAACCDAPGRSQAECKRAMQASCDMEAMADAVAARPEAGFDAARAEQVFAELERRMRQCDVEIVAYGASPEGLGSMFRGSVSAGGDCTPASQLDDVQGGAALVSCEERQSEACLPRLGAWTCTPRAPAGGECFSDDNCRQGLYCDNPELSIRGATCKTRKDADASCAMDNECESLFCRDQRCAALDVQLAYCLLEGM